MVRRRLRRDGVIAFASKLPACIMASLSARMAFLLGDMRTRWDELDRRIAAFDAEFAAMARTDERARRLTGIPGISLLSPSCPCARDDQQCHDARLQIPRAVPQAVSW